MKSRESWPLFFVLLLILALFLTPFFLVILNSFKTYAEVVGNVLALPKSLSLENYVNTFRQMNYPSAFLNTLFITTVGTAGIVLVGSLAGYQIARHKTRSSRIIFFLLIVPMMIPFQSFMISLVKVSTVLGMNGSLWGLSMIYWGLGAPMAVFLYRGFVLGIPRELDEAATIDGCNALQTYWHVIFPILKPVTATVIVINAMWLWNDFLLPLLIIYGNKSAHTLQLTAYSFMGMYKMEWQNIMSGVVLTAIPALVIYMVFQKQIVKGLVTGSIKG